MLGRPQKEGQIPVNDGKKSKQQSERGAPSVAKRRSTRLRRRERKNIESGVAHIRSTFNNTIITITDSQGSVVSWASAGTSGFKGSRKGTPFAAQTAAEVAARTAMDHGMRQIEVLVKGLVQGERQRSGRFRQQASK